MQKYLEARAQFDKTVADARAGDQGAQGRFQDAYNAFLSASQTVNASGAKYLADFAYAQAATEQAAVWAEMQVDVSRASLSALEKQVAGLIEVKSAVLTVGGAIEKLAIAMGAAGAGIAGQSQDRALTSLYQSVLGRDPDAAGLAYWKDRMNGGATLSAISQAFTTSTERTGVPASLINYNTMGSSNTSALVTEIKALREENRLLREDMKRELQGLRADQQQQTGDLIVSNATSAQASASVIADAVSDATRAQIHSTNSTVAPV